MEQEEWNELVSIRREMNGNLMAQDVRTQERYTELLVKSLEGKSDERPGSVSPT
jgi:hypothetical protein